MYIFSCYTIATLCVYACGCECMWVCVFERVWVCGYNSRMCAIVVRKIVSFPFISLSVENVAIIHWNRVMEKNKIAKMSHLVNITCAALTNNRYSVSRQCMKAEVKANKSKWQRRNIDWMSMQSYGNGCWFNWNDSTTSAETFY